MIAVCTPVGTYTHPRTAHCIRALIGRTNHAARANAAREEAFSPRLPLHGGSALARQETIEANAFQSGAVQFELVGVPIVKARNDLTAAALKNPNVTHLLWIDSDMVFPADALERLLAYRLPVVGGLYYGRLPPYKPIVLRNHGASMKYAPGAMGYVYDHPINKLMECDGTGGGFLLVERKVFEAAEMPAGAWWNPVGEEGEDVAFCRRAQAAGHKIYVDTGLELGHIGEVEVTPQWGRRARTFQNNVWLPDVDVGTRQLLADAATPEREVAATVILVAQDAPTGALEATINSILGQKAPTELIIIDNNSVVPIQGLLQLPKHVVMHRFEGHTQSQGRCLNYGLDLAQADWVSFATPGDVWQPNRLERCFYAAFVSESVAVAHDMDVAFSNGTAWMTPNIPQWSNMEQQKKALLAQACIALPSMFIRRDLARETRFREDLAYAAAWNFSLDIAAQAIDDEQGMRS